MIGLAISVGDSWITDSWITDSWFTDFWIVDFWLDSSAIAQQRRCGGSLLRRVHNPPLQRGLYITEGAK
jgi:hypothetical protein